MRPLHRVVGVVGLVVPGFARRFAGPSARCQEFLRYRPCGFADYVGDFLSEGRFARMVVFTIFADAIHGIRGI